tara:strand:- start:379 stop:1098 length:720 start_codon:yes stop_codon:yes gene_type:complete
MPSAKEIQVKLIKKHAAAAIIQKYHYSGKATQNSQLNFGVFINDKLEGALQFGPPIDRRKLLPLVKGSKWGDMIELNRMAFGPLLPKFSESRAIAVCMRIIKKQYGQIKWVVSFADGTQCGDGTIYRASGFVLTSINKNSTIARLPSGEIVALHGTSKRDMTGAERLAGHQLRYIKFLDESEKQNLTVPIIPFAEIDKRNAGMYLGEKKSIKQRRAKEQELENPSNLGGAIPTCTLQSI